MPSLRLMSRLDIKGPNVVKGIHLEGLRVVGNPGELARRYYAEGTDEIIFMDIVASLYERNNILSVVEDTARDVFVPLTVGGGLRAIDDITSALRSGADKVSINTAAVRRPEFIAEAARTFGSQCIVISIEAKLRDGRQWEAMTDNGRERTGLDAVDWALQAEQLGAGELLVTSVDREGTRKGLDIDLLASIRRKVKIPVIGCGGVGAPEHILAAHRAASVDAVACASIFHYGVCPIASMKAALRNGGVDVRE